MLLGTDLAPLKSCRQIIFLHPTSSKVSFWKQICNTVQVSNIVFYHFPNFYQKCTASLVACFLFAEQKFIVYISWKHLFIPHFSSLKFFVKVDLLKERIQLSLLHHDKSNKSYRMSDRIYLLVINGMMQNDIMLEKDDNQSKHSSLKSSKKRSVTQ